MNKQSVFILGGSPLQIDLLTTVRDRYISYVIDANPNCYLADKCDHFICLDFSNVEELEAYARKIEPVFILTMASEQGNLSAAIVSERLGLLYNSIETVEATINKVKMKKKMLDNGIPTSSIAGIYKKGELPNISEHIKYPVVVKPAQSSAGRGVKYVESFSGLSESVKDAQEVSKDCIALVEECFEGRQYSVETITCCGKHYILGITEEYFMGIHNFVETQQIFPALLNQKMKDKIYDLIYKILNAFDVMVGACHIELRINEIGEINIIEIASRIGGWRSELIYLALGVNYTNLFLNSYVQKELQITHQKNNYSMVKMVFDESYTLNYEKFNSNSKCWVSPIVWLKSDFSEEKTSLMDSAGYYFVESHDYEELCCGDENED